MQNSFREISLLTSASLPVNIKSALQLCKRDRNKDEYRHVGMDRVGDRAEARCRERYYEHFMW